MNLLFTLIIQKIKIMNLLHRILLPWNLLSIPNKWSRLIFFSILVQFLMLTKKTVSNNIWIMGPYYLYFLNKWKGIHPLVNLALNFACNSNINDFRIILVIFIPTTNLNNVLTNSGKKSFLFYFLLQIIFLDFEDIYFRSVNNFFYRIIMRSSAVRHP